ncbi:ferredoxin [Chlamydia ibidis 10-1398/6]|uniref:Ferredoxin n=1 Tax=Chlamydia ibidis 10-1398/6 TaxID=1046581 RepID=A0ABN0MYM2_9CHLA|nr:hypothetical protein [Chlamydia ibidis]EQM62367.1 ferredoxin [Chlamydia ibidis 10-1398/6]
MNRNTLLVFSCPNCIKGEVSFSLFNLEGALICNCCSCSYIFDASMRNSIRQFVALCARIHESSSILGHASIAVSSQNQTTEIPFQLLFSRFPVTLNLSLNGKKISIRFIFDALKNVILHQEDKVLV